MDSKAARVGEMSPPQNMNILFAREEEMQEVDSRKFARSHSAKVKPRRAAESTYKRMLDKSKFTSIFSQWQWNIKALSVVK